MWEKWIIYLSGFLAAFLMLLLLLKKQNQKANRFMALALLMSVLTFIAFFRYQTLTEGFHLLFAFAYLTAIPLAYHYVFLISSVDDRLQWYSGLHLVLPISYLVFYALRNSVGFEIWLYRVVAVSMIAYGLLAIFRIRRFHSRIRHTYSNLEKINLSWLQLSFIILAGMGLVWLLYTQIYTSSTDSLQYSLATQIAMSLFWLCGTASLAWFQAEMHSNNVSGEAIAIEKGSIPPFIVAESISKVPKPKAEKKLLKKLVFIMEHKQPFKDPGFRIENLAAMIGTTPSKVDNLLAECMHQDFYQFVNEHRIDLAKRLLIDGNRNPLEIATEVGYRSLSSFTNEFKAHAGMKPELYRYSIEREYA